jgi:hypothetical protein
MVDCDNVCDSDVLDTEILEQENGEKKQPAKKDNSGFFTLLFAAVMLISLVAWSFTHYLI